MIYTLTLNPCIDITRRTGEEFIVPGGKGINVSLMLTKCKIPNMAIGLIGGPVGDIIEASLRIKGVESHFIHILGNNRTNVKEIHLDGQIIEKNEEGPEILASEIEALFQFLDTIEKKSVFVMSGSVPLGVPKDIYAQIMLRLKKKKIIFVVDTTSDALLATLPLHPYIIKPNKEELLALFENSEDKDLTLLDKARILVKKGARNVIVSLGDHGAIWLHGLKEIYRQSAFEGPVVNTVGCGDSLVAGVLYSLYFDEDISKALRAGVAFGSATSFRPWLADLIDIAMLLENK